VTKTVALDKLQFIAPTYIPKFYNEIVKLAKFDKNYHNR